MRYFLLFISVVFLLSACSDDSGTETKRYQCTVIVYMSAENDLQYYIYDNLADMKAGSKSVSGNNRFVVFVDNASAVTKPYIAEINDGRCDTIMHFENEFYSSDPEKFAEVIDIIEKKYPSEKYGLVLWGHATGWLVCKDTIAQSSNKMARPRKAYGVDSGVNQAGSKGYRWMNITQMAKALQKFPRFKFILADCCCMMCVETCYELRHVTDYLIGSPAEIPGEGAPYSQLIKYLFSKSDDFYREIVDCYYDHYLEEFRKPEWTNDDAYSYLENHSVPLAVVDMNYMEELAQATRDVLQSPYTHQFDSVPYYFYYDYPVMYDMSCLLEKNCVPEDYAIWRKTLEKAVPYRRFSACWETIYRPIMWQMEHNGFHYNEKNYGGISMFVPQAKYDASPDFLYNNGIKNFAWYKAVGWDRFE